LTDATNGTLGQTTQNVPESSAAQEASTTIPGAPPVPAGASAPAADLTAIDLGFGVAIPVPPGWQVAADQRGGKTMSNGTASVSISVAGRAAGEDPAVPIQEH